MWSRAQPATNKRIQPSSAAEETSRPAVTLGWKARSRGISQQNGGAVNSRIHQAGVDRPFVRDVASVIPHERGVRSPWEEARGPWRVLLSRLPGSTNNIAVLLPPLYRPDCPPCPTCEGSTCRENTAVPTCPSSPILLLAHTQIHTQSTVWQQPPKSENCQLWISYKVISMWRFPLKVNK